MHVVKKTINIEAAPTMSLKNMYQEITWATACTGARIIITPFIVYAMMAGNWTVAFILFVIAALTDLFDGMLARALGQQTAFGTRLDPVADKIFLLSSFFALALVPSPLFKIPLWFAVLVACKEVVIVGGAGILLLLGKPVTIQPTWLGKITTDVQVAFIVWLFLCYFFDWLPVRTYYVLLGLLTTLVGASCVQYLRIGLGKRKGNLS